MLPSPEHLMQEKQPIAPVDNKMSMLGINKTAKEL